MKINQTDNSGKLVVCTGAYNNPDFGQGIGIRVPFRFQIISNVDEAIETCRNFILKHNLGGGNWGINCGAVYDWNGEKKFQVTYNCGIKEPGDKYFIPGKMPKCLYLVQIATFNLWQANQVTLFSFLKNGATLAERRLALCPPHE